MEIKLSDEDFEKLATVLERKIGDRVIGLLLNNRAHEELSDRAKAFAKNMIDQSMLDYYLEQAVKNALNVKNNAQLVIADIVLKTIADVGFRDKELRDVIAKEMHAAAVAEAERIAEHLGLRSE